MKTVSNVNKIGLTLIFGSVLLFGGCTSQQSSVKPVVKKPISIKKVSNKEILWAKRNRQLLNAKSWVLDGKVAMRYKVDNWNFGVNWKQTGANNAVINIKNPFTGATVALITQNNNKVSLQAADGKIYQDTNAEKLLKRQAGIELPLSGLVYWARGIMAPQYKKGTFTLDSAGRPTQIVQENWLIKYPRYENASYNSLPKKIVLTRKKDAVYVKMIAKKWQAR